MIQNRHRRFIGAASVALLMLAAAPGRAQESGDIEADAEAFGDSVIVVTAQKRETNLQETAASISAVSGDTLQDRQIVDIEGLAQQLPSVNFGQTTGNARIAIRAQTAPSLELCALVAGLLRAQLRALAPDAEVSTVASQALGDAADIYVLSWSTGR